MKLFENGGHNLLFAIAIAGLALCVESTFKMFFLDWDMKIQSKELVCEEPLHNRCSMIFTMINREGVQTKSSVFIYLLDSDAISVGNHIEKNRFSFSYKVNGVKRYWEYWPTILKFFIPSIILLRLWLSPQVRRIINSVLGP